MRRQLLALAAVLVLGATACQRAEAEPAHGPAESAETEQLAQAETPTSQPTSMPSEDEGHDEHEEHGGGTPGDQAAGSTQHYGAAFAIDGDPLSLAEAIDTCAGTGEPCKVTGTIDRVCQARGCWFTLADPAVQQVVRIRMQDYGFFVPRNAMGMNVVFEGTLEREEVPQDVAQHYADDEAAATGRPARQVAGPEDAYQFMITGADITAP